MTQKVGCLPYNRANIMPYESVEPEWIYGTIFPSFVNCARMTDFEMTKIVSDPLTLSSLESGLGSVLVWADPGPAGVWILIWSFFP